MPYNGAMSKKKSKTSSNQIAQNQRANFDYKLLEDLEERIALTGW